MLILFYVDSLKNSLLINKPEAKRALLLPPLSPSALRFTAIEKREKSKEGFEVTSGNRTRDFPHRRSHT